MGAYTTRLSLYKPGGGSTGTITPDEPVDIDLINGNFDKIDAALGIVACTSTTYPSSPYKDQWVLVTDQNTLKRWNGSSWADAISNAGVGSSAGRTAVTTAPSGTTWYETDTGKTYRWISGAWRLWDSGTTWTDFTLASGITATGGGQPAPRWIVRWGTLHVEGSVQGTFASGTYYSISTSTNGIPADYLPAYQVFSGAAGMAGHFAVVNFQTDGTIEVNWNNGGTAYSVTNWIGFSFAIPYGA